MTIPIIDLHCDLLSFLEEDAKRTPYDGLVHCSIPQLKEGDVKLQILAVFTRTHAQSVFKAAKQIEIYKSLSSLYPEDFSYYLSSADFFQTKPIQFLIAIENASGLWDEQEPFERGLDRLNSLIQANHRPLYIGLTWNTENRFGGGNLTKVGLKEDGKRLLEELHGRNIAVDLSHTSDALADGVLDYIEYKSLHVPVLASHSNARRVCDAPRNLPDTLAKEIFKREGIVGLNFYHLFVGQNEQDFVKHIEHWLELGGERQISFGADFFYEGDAFGFSATPTKKPYFSSYQDAGCYPRMLAVFEERLGLSTDLLKGLAYENALRFIKSLKH